MTDEFNHNTERFLHWLKQNGVAISSSIRIADLRAEGRGRGVVASKAIAQDETLFAIPRNLILLPGTTTSSDQPRELQNLGEDPWLSLVLTMIQEFSLGSESKWKPYFDVLPSTFDTPIFWSKEEISELQASTLLTKLGKAEADTNFKEKLIPLVKQNSIGPAHPYSDEEVLELAHRMASTIMAYAFDIEPPTSERSVDDDGYASDDDEDLLKGMVPLADLLNADGERNNARLFYEDDQLVMKSIKPIQADEEIFNDYGELPRSDLLRRYGYVTDSYAQWDVVELDLESLIIPVVLRMVPTLDRNAVDGRLEYLEEHGSGVADGYDILRRGVEPDSKAVPPLLGQFPEGLLILIQTLLLPEHEFDQLRVRRISPKLPDLSANESLITPSCIGVLLRICEDRTEQYGTTLGEDYEKRTDASKLSRRQQMALDVRIGEKEILASAIEALRDVIGIRTTDELHKQSVVAANGSHEKGQNKRRRVG